MSNLAAERKHEVEALFPSLSGAFSGSTYSSAPSNGDDSVFLPVGSRLGTYLRQNAVKSHRPIGVLSVNNGTSTTSTPSPAEFCSCGADHMAVSLFSGAYDRCRCPYSSTPLFIMPTVTTAAKDHHQSNDVLQCSSSASFVHRRPSASSLPPFLPSVSRHRPNCPSPLVAESVSLMNSGSDLINRFPQLVIASDHVVPRTCNGPDFQTITPERLSCSANPDFDDGGSSLDFNSRLKDLISFAGKPNSVSPLSNSSWEIASVSPVFREATAFTTPKVVQESIGGTTYFYPGNEVKYPCETRLLPKCYSYNSAASHLVNFTANACRGSLYFASPAIREELLYRQLAAAVEVDRTQYSDLPTEVDSYADLVPLEPVMRSASLEKPGYFGLISTVYKAVSIKDGLCYCLRRFHDFQLANKRCIFAVETWKKIKHANIVQLREAFMTRAFGDNSLVIVYDYHGGAETLKYRHFSDAGCRSPNGISGFSKLTTGCQQPDLVRESAGIDHANEPLPEALLWSYVVDLSSALRTIHSSGLAARTIDPSKILVLGKSRLLINCCSAFDIVAFEQLQNASSDLIQRYQQEDLFNFGRLILSLGNSCLSAAQRENMQVSIDHISQQYSQDLKNLMLHLLHSSRTRSISDIMPMIGARFFSQLNAAQMRIDLLENELSKETENGRLLRLLCKIGVVTERFEYETDSKWSETGERYILKLFRSYLFHQVTETGLPWLDIAHIVQCLNKLDAGVPEKLMLFTHDQQNALIVSYADLHRCLNESFNELAQMGQI